MSTDLLQDDLLEVAKLCHAAMAQDSPNPPQVYLYNIQNLVHAYLSSDQKSEIETYLAEKKYLPEVDIQLAK